MGAEMTATMVVWPKDCRHGGMVLELVEHFRPYWLTRRGGHRESISVSSPEFALCSGLGLASPQAGSGNPAVRIAHWAGRRVTLLRYAGSLVGDAEIERLRMVGVKLEVVDVDGGAETKRSA